MKARAQDEESRAAGTLHKASLGGPAAERPVGGVDHVALRVADAASSAGEPKPIRGIDEGDGPLSQREAGSGMGSFVDFAAPVQAGGTACVAGSHRQVQIDTEVREAGRRF